jgi:hypothetical protein
LAISTVLLGLAALGAWAIRRALRGLDRVFDNLTLDSAPNAIPGPAAKAMVG